MTLSLAAVFLAAVAIGAAIAVFASERSFQRQMDQHFKETRDGRD